MHQLAQDEQYSREGKMYGVLLVKTSTGEQAVLKAFSGLLQGQEQVAGWVPPIAGREQVALEEARTLSQLEALKQELIQLQQLPARSRYQLQVQAFADRLQQLSNCHAQRKQTREQQRQILLKNQSGDELATALEQLNEQSRRDGMERRDLKRERDSQLRSLKQEIDQANSRIRELKHQRKALSRSLQTLMHTYYSLTNFAGQTLPLSQLLPPNSIPTGTGDCCAPKLLHYAATHHLLPLAMAEFWWGPPSPASDRLQPPHNSRQPGQFYPACTERCQPLMGFLLSGLSPHSPSPLPPPPLPPPARLTVPLRSPNVLTVEAPSPLPILHQDSWLIAIDKPAGLLSVPGRYRDRQDSLLTRLQHTLPNRLSLIPVHRLDQDTSGILLLAQDFETHRILSQQFQKREVYKEYEAILAGVISLEQGTIELPLWADPTDRPYQKVDWQRGKPSLTRFQVIAKTTNRTHIRFFPITGRTHQLRVHAAHPAGLGVPILGDRLYGDSASISRLHLHASKLHLTHPHSGQPLCFQSGAPFLQGV
jgi:tRNA pseudouridine32 synthase/23S rRNA pseudouridine746 synthase